MMQNLLINTPFISKLVSVPELFDRTVAPATSPPPSLHWETTTSVVWLNICLSKQVLKCPHIPYTRAHTLTTTCTSTTSLVFSPTYWNLSSIYDGLPVWAIPSSPTRAEKQSLDWAIQGQILVHSGKESWEVWGTKTAWSSKVCQMAFLGPLILGEGKGDFPTLPQLGPHAGPGDPFCLPSFCHVALDWKKRALL